MTDRKSYTHGRNDSTGRYVSPEKARTNKDDYSVIRNPLPGNGTSGRYDDKNKR